MSLDALKEGCVEIVKKLNLETPLKELESMEPQEIFKHFMELKPFFDAIQKRDLTWIPQGPEWIRGYAGTQLDDTTWTQLNQLVMLTGLLGMIPEGMRQQVDQMSKMLMENVKSNPNISDNMAAEQDPQQATEMMKGLQSMMGSLMGNGGGGGGVNPMNLLNMLGADTGSTVSNRRSRRAASRQSSRTNREFHPRRTRRIPNRPPSNPPNTPNTLNTNP